VSVVSPQAIIGEGVTIGALAYVGPNVALGDGVVISEGCIVNNASIGKNTIIQCGVKIGSAALGGLKDSAGNWHDRPHFGCVCIGSNVRIEDNVVINQGYLKDTFISDQVRIGPLSSIGNGVYLAEGVMLAQSVTIAGSVSIGTNSSVWGNASVREGLVIGRNSMVGMGAVVLSNIPDCELWVGNPAACKRKL
jgi:UDP-3-O-[3-hydroxymyristoyl] glucosamine N-acyltransferase